MKPTVSITKQCFLFCFCLCWIVKEFSSQSWQFFLFDVNLFLPVFCPLHYKLSTEASHEMKNKARHKSFIQFNSFPNCAVFTPQLPFTPQVSLLLSCLPSFAFFIPLLSSLLNCRYPQLYSLLSCLHSSAASLFSCLHFSASSTTLPYASTVFPPQLSSLLSCLLFSAVFTPQLSSLLWCIHSLAVFTP